MMQTRASQEVQKLIEGGPAELLNKLEKMDQEDLSIEQQLKTNINRFEIMNKI